MGRQNKILITAHCSVTLSEVLDGIIKYRCIFITVDSNSTHRVIVVTTARYCHLDHGGDIRSHKTPLFRVSNEDNYEARNVLRHKISLISAKHKFKKTLMAEFMDISYLEK